MIALLLALVLTAPASAQPNADATRLFREGVAALRANDYAHAADAFQRSYALDPRVATACNLALTFDRWEGHRREAIEHYDRCAAADTSGRFRPHALERATALREAEAAAARPPGDPPPPPDPAPPDPFVGGPQPGGPPADGQPWGVPIDEGPAPERSHGFLYGGIVVSALAAVSFGIGLYLIEDARADEAYLAREYDDGAIAIPRSSPDLDLLESARARADTGVILYIFAGVLAALGGTLIVIDATAPAVEPSPYAHLAITPLEAGALFTTTHAVTF